MTKTDIDELLLRLDPYLNQSAKYVYDYFRTNKLSIVFFEGTKMDMTPDLALRIYKDLLIDLIHNHRRFGIAYGLTALIRVNEDGDEDASVRVMFGIFFPFDPSP